MSKNPKSRRSVPAKSRPRASTTIKQTSSSYTPRPRPGSNRPIKRSSTPAWLWPLVVVCLVGLGLAVGLILVSNSSSTGGTAVGDIEGVVGFGRPSQEHVSGTVNYPQNPPVGGPHAGAWQNCGIYDQPVGKENAVHSMEHGAVWLTYQPDLPAPSIEQLRQLARGRTFVLLAPYPGLPSAVVASAWGVQLKVDTVNDPRLAQFITKYMQGPQTPELGASCFGALGTPKER